MRVLNVFYVSVVLILLGVIFITGAELGYGLSTRRSAVEMDTVFVKADTVYKPSCVDTLRIEIPCVVDTAAILESYFSKMAYVDTIYIEKFGTLTVVDTVYKNAIDSRHLSYDLSYTLPSRACRQRLFCIGGLWCGKGIAPMAAMRIGRWRMMGGYDFSSSHALLGAFYDL